MATKNYGFGMSKSLAGSGEQYAKVYIQDGKIITPTLTLSAFAMKLAAPLGAKLECKYVQVRATGDGRIHAQLADSPVNRTYGASWNFTDLSLATYLNGADAAAPVYAPKPVYTPAPKPEPKTVNDLFILFGVAPSPAPVSAPAAKPTFVPTAALKATVTPTRFGEVVSMAGTGKKYVMVFCQDHKIITPTAVLDGTALLNACALRGGNADRKFVQVRINSGDSIHAQLPDEGGNRTYGTSFDFVDANLAAYLRG